MEKKQSAESAVLHRMDLRCKFCHKLLGRTSTDAAGVLELRCPKCKTFTRFEKAIEHDRGMGYSLGSGEAREAPKQ